MPSDTFSTQLLDWQAQQGRKDLPWQKSATAYPVWISEIMLQQTQVNTVIPYFQRFMQRFPSVKSLAQAPLDDVLHLWSGLGYYARARNLHQTAQQVWTQHRGRFPNTLDGLTSLPGIGRSTAGAILSLGMNLRAPILDGNVKRVLCRIHGIDRWPGETETQKQLWQLAEALTPTHSFGRYNQAMMDLGALICTRTQPNCPRCPVQHVCQARQYHRTAELPIPKPTKQKPERQVYMLMLLRNQQVWLEKRTAKGIWGGLWSLPEAVSLPALKQLSQQWDVTLSKRQALTPIQHVFTHFKLHIKPYSVRLAAHAKWPSSLPEGRWYDLNCPPAIGLPAPIQILLNAVKK